MTFEAAAANGQCLKASCIDVGLSDVPETMLWTLHNRVSVASDPAKPWFVDDKAVAIYDAIDYDYKKSFGTAEDSHGLRSWLFDKGIRDFWEAHPDTGGTIVNFAEGLETQRLRLEEDRPDGWLWITVDLPSAIQAREKFIEPDKNNLHVAASVLDTGEWMHLIPGDKPVFFTAQGLLMYLEEEDIKGLFQKIAEKFPNSKIWFDSIAKWLSGLTTKPGGWQLTKDYTAPKMPFGVNKDKIYGTFESWVPGLEIEEILWPLNMADSWFIRYAAPILLKIPYIKNLQPGMVMEVQFPPASESNVQPSQG